MQQAVRTMLEQVYEDDFPGFSYGFRPGRSPHGALDALSGGLTQRKVNWVLDANTQGFFDNLDYELLMRAVWHDTDLPWVILHSSSQQFCDMTLTQNRVSGPEVHT